jgi:hypothetical protein
VQCALRAVTEDFTTCVKLRVFSSNLDRGTDCTNRGLSLHEFQDSASSLLRPVLPDSLRFTAD